MPQAAKNLSPLPRFAALFFVLTLLTGCAAKQLPPPRPALDCWAGFQNKYGVPPSTARLAVNASLSWRQGKKTARVILDLWGNFGPPAAFRMDAWSHLGGNLSYIVEDEQGIVALYPDPLRVYTHADPVVGARMLGLPFPFSLAHLASLLAGDFGALVPATFHAATPGKDNGWLFTFTDGPVSALGLDARARPLFMEGPAMAWSNTGESVPAGRWRIAFSRYESTKTGRPEQPARMDLTLPPDSSGILRIKARELTLTPWPEKALKLVIPDAAPIHTLDQRPRDWTTGSVPQPMQLEETK